jgi:pimeloyl-ACP methyl ester carboxylesterase
MRSSLLVAPALMLACAQPTASQTTHPTRSPAMTSDAVSKMPMDVKGSGAPLVLVGGGLTGWLSWEPHQARLASTRLVGRAQLLAVQYGLDNLPLPSGYSVRTESRALAAAIDAHMPPGAIDLAAWSFGGEITLDYALEHPDRVRTLTLIEPPAFWVLDATGTGDAESARQSDEMHALYRAMTSDVTEDQLAAFVCQAGLCPPGKSPKELPQWPVWVKHRRSLRTGEAPWAHTDTAARLHSFDRPVLLVKGTGSAHVLHRIEDGLARALPNARMIELPGGHAPNIVAMDAFLESLAAFERDAVQAGRD